VPAPPRILDRSTARNCLLTNLLVIPGGGSLVAGRRVGWLQAGLAGVGVGLTLWWAVGLAVEWIRTRELPLAVDARFWGAVAGVVLFIIAWFWSLATGLAILRTANESSSATRPTS